MKWNSKKMIKKKKNIKLKKKIRLARLSKFTTKSLSGALKKFQKQQEQKN